jgi:uroporphyrinogen-III synthase
MAILKSSLEEPLLTREQTSVIRAIAHSAQIAEAIKQLGIIDDIMTKGLVPRHDTSEILDYLKAEASRVLMQIKVPRRSTTTTTQADTKNTVV